MNGEREHRQNLVIALAEKSLNKGWKFSRTVWERTRTPVAIAGIGAVSTIAAEKMLVNNVIGKTPDKVVGTLIDAKLLNPVKITLDDGTVVEQDPAVVGFVKVCVTNRQVDTQTGKKANNDQCTIHEGYLKVTTAGAAVLGGQVSEESDFFYGARHITITSRN